MRAQTRAAMVVLMALSVAAPARAHDFRCTKSIGTAVTDAAGNPLFQGDVPWLRTGETVGVGRIQAYPTIVGFDVALQNVADRESVVVSVYDSLAELGSADVIGVYGAELVPGTRIAPGEIVHRFVLVRIGSYENCLALGGEPPIQACVGAIENRFTVFHESGSAECRARIVCEPQTDAWVGVRTIGDTEASSDAADAHVGSDGRLYVTGFIAGPWLPALPVGADTDGFIAGFTSDGEQAVAYRYGVPDYYALGRFTPVPGGVVAIAQLESGERRVKKLALADGAEVWSSSAVTEPADVSAAADGSLYVSSDAVAGRQLAKLGPEGALVWSVPADVGARVAVHPGGGAYVGGITMPARKALVARFDAAGQLLWTHSFSTPYSADEAVAGIAVAPDGALYVALRGAVTLPSTEVIEESFIVKLDGDGGEVWTRSLDDGFRLEAVSVGPGGVWAGGETEGKVFVVRLDGAGGVQWRTVFGNGFGMEGIEAIAVDAEANAYVAGWSEVYGGSRLHGFVAKIGPEGVVR